MDGLYLAVKAFIKTGIITVPDHRIRLRPFPFLKFFQRKVEIRSHRKLQGLCCLKRQGPESERRDQMHDIHALKSSLHLRHFIHGKQRRILFEKLRETGFFFRPDRPDHKITGLSLLRLIRTDHTHFMPAGFEIADQIQGGCGHPALFRAQNITDDRDLDSFHASLTPYI